MGIPRFVGQYVSLAAPQHQISALILFVHWPI